MLSLSHSNKHPSLSTFRILQTFHRWSKYFRESLKLIWEIRKSDNAFYIFAKVVISVETHISLDELHAYILLTLEGKYSKNFSAVFSHGTRTVWKRSRTRSTPQISMKLSIKCDPWRCIKLLQNACFGENEEGQWSREKNLGRPYLVKTSNLARSTNRWTQ